MWVVDMEKKLEDAEPSAKVEKWRKHCILRVPPRFKPVDCSVYKPQTVALGPFHRDDPDLKPMEEHKLRAVRHLLGRAGKSLRELVAAVEEVADELEDAYMDLGGEWCGENRGKFLAMMITDGCFLLEVMSTAAVKRFDPAYEEHHDPVFSWHGIQHIKPFVQRDMLMIENQIPLRVLEIVAAETGQLQSNGDISGRVLAFLNGNDAAGGALGLHPLDVYRRSLLKPPGKAHHRGAADAEAVDLTKWKTPRSAQKLANAGIRFRCKRKGPHPLDDICFNTRTRVVKMPKVCLDDSTEYKYRNMMAFEAMHVGTGNDMTAFVLFMKDIIDSADDVILLTRKWIVDHDLADDDKAVVKLFNTLTKDVYKNGESHMCGVRDTMEHYYTDSWMRQLVYEPWAGLKNKYFRSPWTTIALLAAILLVATDITQTVYAVRSYEHPKNQTMTDARTSWGP